MKIQDTRKQLYFHELLDLIASGTPKSVETQAHSRTTFPEETIGRYVAEYDDGVKIICVGYVEPCIDGYQLAHGYDVTIFHYGRDHYTDGCVYIKGVRLVEDVDGETVEIKSTDYATWDKWHDLVYEALRQGHPSWECDALRAAIDYAERQGQAQDN